MGRELHRSKSELPEQVRKQRAFINDVTTAYRDKSDEEDKANLKEVPDLIEEVPDDERRSMSSEQSSDKPIEDRTENSTPLERM